MSGALTAEQIQAGIDRSTFSGFLGLKVVEIDPANQTLKMYAPMRAEFERSGDSGQWHGGPIAAIVDTVGDFALAMIVGRPLPTINFRIDYLRPAMRTGLAAVASVRRSGRSVGVVDVDVLDDSGKLVAIGRATYATREG